MKPKETLLEDITGEAKEGEGTLAEGPKDPVPEEVQVDQPLETSNPPLVLNPINTTCSLVGDPNFVEFVDLAQVKALFGTSVDPVISQIETSTVEPTIPLGFNKNMVDQRKISPEKERWDAPLSPLKEPPGYIYVKNPAYMERWRFLMVDPLEFT